MGVVRGAPAFDETPERRESFWWLTLAGRDLRHAQLRGAPQRLPRQFDDGRIDHAAIQAEHAASLGLKALDHAARPVGLCRRWRKGRVHRRHLRRMNAQLAACEAAGTGAASAMTCVVPTAGAALRASCAPAPGCGPMPPNAPQPMAATAANDARPATSFQRNTPSLAAGRATSSIAGFAKAGSASNADVSCCSRAARRATNAVSWPQAARSVERSTSPTR